MKGTTVTNLEVVRRMYAAFGERDRDAILALFDPQIEWVQNEGFPGGGRHVGADAVLTEVFATFRREWDGWQAVVTEWLDTGDAVVAVDEYRGTYTATGRSMRAAFAGVYRVRAGRIVSFHQYTDTAKIVEATRATGADENERERRDGEPFGGERPSVRDAPHRPERTPMIRPAVPADTPALVALSGGSGLFRPEELDAVRGMLDEYHATNAADGHRILACEEGGSPVGLASFAPKGFTDRVWELLMIAVDAPRQRQGIGSRMLLAVEERVRAAGGRLLLIETSSKSSFERTRQFYRKHGYSEVAYIPDYFADGDGKASFVKRL